MKLFRLIYMPLSDFANRCVSGLLSLIPIKNMVVLECESDMEDNPRAFYEYLLAKKWNTSHKIIWIVNDVDLCQRNYKTKNVVFLNRNSGSLRNKVRLKYYLSVARYFIFSHPYWYRKRRQSQIIVNIWHGTPIKDISPTDDQDTSEWYDWWIVASEHVRPWIVKTGCPYEKTVICGYPRLDELFTGNKKEIMPKIFGWQRHEKVIICLPTYKQSTKKKDSLLKDVFSIDVVHNEEELKCLNKKLKENDIHLIIKPHPLQVTDDLWLNDMSNIHYISNRLLLERHIIFYELLGCCDALITDLSSVIFDYVLVDKPIGVLTGNFDKYARGYIVENIMDYLPGVHIKTLDELISFVDDFKVGKDSFSEQRKEMAGLLNKLPSGNYCEEFSKWLFSLK